MNAKLNKYNNGIIQLKTKICNLAEIFTQKPSPFNLLTHFTVFFNKVEIILYYP